MLKRSVGARALSRCCSRRRRGAAHASSSSSRRGRSRSRVPANTGPRSPRRSRRRTRTCGSSGSRSRSANSSTSSPCASPATTRPTSCTCRRATSSRSRARAGSRRSTTCSRRPTSRTTYTKMSDEMRYDGKTYGVLMMAYGMMFYYNEKMLQDAKVAVPKTSDELLKAIAATTDAKAGRFGWGAPTTEHPNLYVEVGHVGHGRGRELLQGQPVQLHRSRRDPRGGQVPRGGEERAEGHDAASRRGSSSSTARSRCCATGRG